jgi:hypothetical protein
MNTEIKKFGIEIWKAVKALGIAFWTLLKSIGLFLNECYSWLAYIRMKAPRTSLGIELIIFISILVYHSMSCYVDKTVNRDKCSKKLYDMEVQYNDSIIKAEIEGYNRGYVEGKNEKERKNQEQQSGQDY